jgi:hypothetical protein
MHGRPIPRATTAAWLDVREIDAGPSGLIFGFTL